MELSTQQIQYLPHQYPYSSGGASTRLVKHFL